MREWLVAIAVFVVLVALLPGLLRRSRAKLAQGGGGGMWVGIGLGLAMLFDPKVTQAMEIVEQKKGEAEEDVSGDEP